MKVLMLSWEYPPHIVGGLGKHVVDLVPELIAHGVEVHLVVPKLRGGADNEPLLMPDGSPATNGSQVYRIEVDKTTAISSQTPGTTTSHIEDFCTRLIRRGRLRPDSQPRLAERVRGHRPQARLPSADGGTIHATEMGRTRATYGAICSAQYTRPNGG